MRFLLRPATVPLLIALLAATPSALAQSTPQSPAPAGPGIGDRISDWLPAPGAPSAAGPTVAPPAHVALPDDWSRLLPSARAGDDAPDLALPLRSAERVPAVLPATSPSPAAAPRASASTPFAPPRTAVAATAVAATAVVATPAPSVAASRGAPWPSDPVAAPFSGSDLFVGRSMPVVTRTHRYEVGIASQVVPLDLVLASNRDALIAQGVNTACASSADPACQTQAQAVAGQALNVLEAIPDGQWNGLLAVARDPAAVAKTLKTYGVTNASDVQAVQQYVASLPADRRTQALVIARRLSDGVTSSVRLEPYANLDLAPVRVRVGVPFQVGAGNSTTSDLGNLSLDAGKGWAFAVPGARLGVAVGLSASLPTSTGTDRPSMMADLFQAPKYVPGYLTLTPYFVAGVDHRWVSLQVHGDLWIQNRVRSVTGAANLEVLQYGLGLTIAPHYYVSLLAQLEGVEGLHAADAYKALFVVAGLQLNLWYVRLGAALQVPVVDRNKEDLGTWQGLDVGSLAKYSVLSRLSVAF